MERPWARCARLNSRIAAASANTWGEALAIVSGGRLPSTA